MEGREKKELKASSDEADSPPEDDKGTSSAAAARGARFYECVFCKRGFSSAQALGGHMNIHRRDRSRIRPAAARRAEEGYHPYSREQHRHAPLPAVVESSASYVVYLPGSSSSSAVGSRGAEGKRPELGGEELRLRLGEPSKERMEEEKEDLDLELRLGHGGRHDL